MYSIDFQHEELSVAKSKYLPLKRFDFVIGSDLF
jgi:hypothetical protein